MAGMPDTQSQGGAERDAERMDAERVDRAIDLIRSGDARGAEQILRDVVGRTPPDYRTRFERDGELFVKFWAAEDFLHFVTTMKERGAERPVSWLPNAYPRAHYYLAFLRVKAGDPAAAISLLHE